MKSDVIYLPAGPVPALPSRRTRLMTDVVLAVAGLAMTSCTTFGTNISGKFGCGAPAGGSCAPATVIDDKALAEITGDTSFRPAVQYQQAPVRSAPESVAIAATGTVGVRPQKVLRIVFPAHTDGAGRYHETSVVQAVVDSGQWVAATNGHGPGHGRWSRQPTGHCRPPPGRRSSRDTGRRRRYAPGRRYGGPSAAEHPPCRSRRSLRSPARSGRVPAGIAPQAESWCRR